MSLPKDDAAVLSARWTEGVLLKRDVFSTVERGRFRIDSGDLDAVRLGRGMAWLDMGTPDALLEAAQFVQALERRQGLKIACPEEIALMMGFIDRAQFIRLANEYSRSSYGEYLRAVAQGLR